MRHFLAASLLGLTLFGCQPSVPRVAVEDIPAPANATVVLKLGDNLRAVGAAAYGHERFSGFVARLNGIADPERVMAGATLKLPSLSIAFRDAGLDPRYQPAINVLAKSCTDFHAVLPAYLNARNVSGVGAGHFAISSDLQRKLAACADGIDAACRVLRSPPAPHAAPKMTIAQFTQVSDGIRELARGSIDGYGYDYDLVGQRFGLAFTNAIVWTQSGHR